MPYPPVRLSNRDAPRVINEPTHSLAEIDLEVIVAAENRDLKRAESSLIHGANINCLDYRLYADKVYNRSPLMIAAGNNDIAMVRFLLGNGADPNQEDLCKYGCDRHQNWMGANSLIYSMRHGPAFYGESDYDKKLDLELIRLIVEHGGNVNWTTGTNESPIIIAVKSNDYETASYLIQSGSSTISCVDPDDSALRIAICKCDRKMISLLLESGWDANEVYPMDGKCPLSTTPGAKTHADAVDIAKELINVGAKIDRSAKNGCTALFSAISYKNRNLVELLLAKNANPNIVNRQGLTCLDNAKLRGDEEIINMVIKSGGLCAVDLNGRATKKATKARKSE